MIIFLILSRLHYLCTYRVHYFFITNQNNMLISTVWSILFAISLTVHQLIFVFFTLSLVRILTHKYTPYASLCVAIVSIIQVIFNGCPVTDLNNYLLLKAGFNNVENNAFWGGIFGEYTSFARFLLLFVSLVMFYYSYKTWKKVAVPVSLSRIFSLPSHYGYVVNN
jgi:hypothetical protein